MAGDGRLGDDSLLPIESWAGEIRVNLIRLCGIAAFYARHLIEFAFARPDSPVRGTYHTRVTILISIWAIAAILLHAQLRRRRVMPSLKYLATAWDLLMVTMVCMLGGTPRTPLVLLYLLVIAAAPLRLSLRLVYATTAGAAAAYLCLLAYYAWYVIGFKRYYATLEVRVPRKEEAIVLLAILTAGFLAGQLVRQAGRLIQGYPAQVREPGEGQHAD